MCFEVEGLIQTHELILKVVQREKVQIRMIMSHKD
jgi:hypothetical protein